MQAVDEFDRPLTGFESQFEERAPLKPDLIVCLNPNENRVLLRECSTNQIPSIGLVDTDTNPTLVTYPIPANDDRSVTRKYCLATS
jgi:small subunit ribosomal protein S2